MLPWFKLASARAPDGTELSLWQRGDELVVRAGGVDLMSSRSHGSEDFLATIACERIGAKPGAAVLIGGLGLGSTLRAALAALPKFAPLPPFLPQTLSVASIGQASLLAGDLDGALPYLRKASASCMAMYRPIANTRAYAGLGDVLLAKKDRAGACGAYQVVLDRWGNERRSVTAQAVRARRSQMRCE